jgi:hypothetical protein
MIEKDKATLDFLVGILQGNKDISEADKILPPVTLTHLDNYKFDTSIEAWQAWWIFLREKGRVSNVSGASTEMKQNADGTYTLVGEWTGEYEGKQVVSAPISASYRIRDGKIVEIWTTRKNYIFFFRIIRYRIGFWIVVLYWLLWRRFLQKSREPALNYS